MVDIDLIKNIFEKHIHQKVCLIHPIDNVTNNRVYRIETESTPFIFKIYKSGWPEDGKLLFVDRQLTLHQIPHAKIVVYNRDSADFPHGYLIEECLPGITADRLALSREDMIILFEKLGALVSRLHQIRLTGYGYIGSGVGGWDRFSDFMADSLNDNTVQLLSYHLAEENELILMGQELGKRLKKYDSGPPVLCHTDLSTKNVLVNKDDITLIDWDDAYSLCWMADVASFTLWLKREYDADSALIYRQAFLESYKTDRDIQSFYEIEDILHVRYGLDLLNYFVGNPQYDNMKLILKESFQKCGMKALKCL